jgi:hypothetical protein
MRKPRPAKPPGSGSRHLKLAHAALRHLGDLAGLQQLLRLRRADGELLAVGVGVAAVLAQGHHQGGEEHRTVAPPTGLGTARSGREQSAFPSLALSLPRATHRLRRGRTGSRTGRGAHGSRNRTARTESALGPVATGHPAGRRHPHDDFRELLTRPNRHLGGALNPRGVCGAGRSSTRPSSSLAPSCDSGPESRESVSRARFLREIGYQA